MANIGVFQETNPVGAGHSLVGAIFKDEAHTMLVSSVVYIAPYTGQTQLHTFITPTNKVYYYVCYESPDGTPTGTIRNYFATQPGNNSYNVRDDLFLIADTSPTMVSNTSTYGPDASLIGWNWGIERKGQGTMQYNVDYVKTKAGVDTIQDDLDADGWRLLVPGDVFSSGEIFVIHFLPQLITNSTASDAVVISQTNILAVNTTLDATATGQSFLLMGSGGYFQVTLPDLDTMSDNEPLYFLSLGGNHINVGLFSKTGQKMQWFTNQGNLTGNTPTDHLYLGQCEMVALYKFTFPDSSKRWLILNGAEGCNRVGEQILSYSKQGVNQWFMNGQLLSRQNNARLWEWVNTLEASMLIVDSAYNNTVNGGVNAQNYLVNNGKFTLGDGSTTFRLPTVFTYGFQRFVSGSGRLPGTMEIGHIEAHYHTLHGDGTINGAGGPYYLGRNLNAAYSGGGSDLLGRRPVSGANSGPDITLRTGNDNNRPVTTALQPETAPNNFGIYGLIRG